MTSRSFAQKLYKCNQKILKWTVRAEEAATRKEALKALRKIAKFSLRLAALQGRAYTEYIDNQGQ